MNQGHSTIGAYGIAIASAFALVCSLAEAASPEDAAGGSSSSHPYFGELHVHTHVSMDAFIVGDRANTPEDAYRFARGEEIEIFGGRKIRLARPLDFVAVTDHSESFAEFQICHDERWPGYTTDMCRRVRAGDGSVFGLAWGGVAAWPARRLAPTCTGEECREAAKVTWSLMRDVADRFNEPGRLTTFIGYEYSPALTNGGMMHRNVIFANADVPDHAMSAFDVAMEDGLWAWLDDACTGSCDVVAIPHNMNYSWGLAFRLEKRDGKPYTDKDLSRRARYETVAEIFQIKGASECAVGLGAPDEECAFNQLWPVCEGSETNLCEGQGSTIRGGLARGLEAEAENGLNPFKLGFIGSTDNHNAAPGSTDEWAYEGQGGALDDTVEKRLSVAGRPDRKGSPAAAYYNPGGLAGVWAEENTRPAIFAALKRRQTFATSGPRLAIRLFAGDRLSNDLLAEANWPSMAYALGTAMGGDLPRGSRAPTFLVEASRDPASAALFKVQIVKGWLENGVPQEAVVDIACAGGAAPDAKTGRCPDNGASVDLATCSRDEGVGVDAFQVAWTDPHFDPKARAYYYARVLENPTCRWSTLQAHADNREPPRGLPATQRERAWSSPVWYSPDR
ncbi:MAG: DUF3604 domain-containing protein [Alphaproteobacteria bacterium]|nr:DUF3604 domain-containing protein [Alphaproteobacteria bacterium]